MDRVTRLKQEIHLLIYGKSKTKEGTALYDLADHVGKTSSYLSRIANLNEEVPLPIEIALKIMQLKKRYGIIQFMASELGGVFIKLPKFKTKKHDENDMGSDYQKTAAEAVSAFIDFLYEPTKNNYLTCEKKLNKIIESSMGAKIFVQRKATNQEELF
jgi:hypothetical protein